MATELVEDPVSNAHEAMEADAGNVGATIAELLEKTPEETDNVEVELATIKKAQEERSSLTPRRLTSCAKCITKRLVHGRTQLFRLKRPLDENTTRLWVKLH